MSTVSTKEAMARIPVLPAKKMRKAAGKKDSQDGLFGQPVVIHHINGENFITLIADDHQGLISWGEDLVLLQRTIEQVIALGNLPLEASAQQFQCAGLFSGADEASVHNSGVVYGQHPCGAAAGSLIVDGAFIPCGEKKKGHDEQQAYRHWGVIAAFGAVAEKVHMSDSLLFMIRLHRCMPERGTS